MARKRRIYTAHHSSTVSTVSLQILRILSTNEVVRLLRLDIHQENQPLSEQIEMRKVTLVRPSVPGSGSTTLTPRPHQEGIPASGTTVQGGFDPGGSGTPIMDQWTMNTKDGLRVRWPGETGWVISPGEDMIVRLFLGVLSFDLTYSITFEELGD